MKKQFISGLLSLLCLTSYSYAGEAIVPMIHAAPIASSYLMTDIHIKNLSNETQRVKLVVYTYDGSVAANRPLRVVNSEVVSFTTTDSNGEITSDVQGRCTLYYGFQSNSEFLDGWGKLSSSLVSGPGTGYIVAHGILRNGNIYSTAPSAAIPINNGMPF